MKYEVGQLIFLVYPNNPDRSNIYLITKTDNILSLIDLYKFGSVSVGWLHYQGAREPTEAEIVLYADQELLDLKREIDLYED